MGALDPTQHHQLLLEMVGTVVLAAAQQLIMQALQVEAQDQAIRPQQPRVREMAVGLLAWTHNLVVGVVVVLVTLGQMAQLPQAGMVVQGPHQVLQA